MAKKSDMDVWLKKIFVPGVLHKDLSLLNTGFGVKNVDDKFYSTCETLGRRYISETSIKAAQIEQLIDDLCKYTYVLNGNDVVFTKDQMLLTIVLFCKDKNVIWSKESTKASPYEIPYFLNSTFGKLLDRAGCVAEDLKNSASFEAETTAEESEPEDLLNTDTKAEKPAEAKAEQPANVSTDETPAAGDKIDKAPAAPLVVQDPEIPLPTSDSKELAVGIGQDIIDAVAKQSKGKVELGDEIHVIPADQAQDLIKKTLEAEAAIKAKKKATSRKKKNKSVLDNPNDYYYGNITDDPKYQRDEWLKDANGNYVLDRYGHLIHKPRITGNRSSYPSFSSYVRNLVGTPGSPIPMTGENGVLYIIKGRENFTSSKCPKAYVMPLTMDKNKDWATNPQQIPVNNLNSKKRINSKGELKVHIAGSSSLQNQCLFFNTKAEAERVLQAIKDADAKDAEEQRKAGLSDKEIKQTARIAEGVNVNQLVCAPIQLLTTDEHWRNNLTVFKRGFYQVDTEFGRQWLGAYYLLESLSSNGNLILEELPSDEIKEDKVEESFIEKYANAYTSDFS